jgi:trehalose 2-sulfotransferase
MSDAEEWFAMLSGLSGFSGARYDFELPGTFRKAYVIAATYRSGSTYLCTLLWKSGVLGAPFEYFNYEYEMRLLQARFNARTPGEYVRALVEHRTSPNGIFGVKLQYAHFKAFVRRYPDLLKDLAPVRFLYIERQDKVAQAVSLAKALQSRAWFSVTEDREAQMPLFYSYDFIATCLNRLQNDCDRWRQWFRENGIDPVTMYYEELCARGKEVTSQVVQFLEVEKDVPAPVSVPSLERQADEINESWIVRFRDEQRHSRA